MKPGSEMRDAPVLLRVFLQSEKIQFQHFGCTSEDGNGFPAAVRWCVR